MAVGAAEPARVLVVTLDAGLGVRLERALARAGYAAQWEWSSLTALATVAMWRPAVVVLDWTQPFIDGATFVAALRAGVAAPPAVVALVADDTAGVMQVGVAAVLSMPVDPAELLAVVGRLLAPPGAGSDSST